MMARQGRKSSANHATHWRVYRRGKPAGDLLAVLRLDAANRSIEDCVLIPASSMTKPYLRLTSVVELSAVRAGSIAELMDTSKSRLRSPVAKRRTAQGR
jgi:hypothetical protein